MTTVDTVDTSVAVPLMASAPLTTGMQMVPSATVIGHWSPPASTRARAFGTFRSNVFANPPSFSLSTALSAREPTTFGTGAVFPAADAVPQPTSSAAVIHSTNNGLTKFGMSQ